MESAKFIEVCADVRYWEDASVNGIEDKDGSLMPFRKGSTWNPTIRLSDGSVSGWPQGSTADIHYKVCDAGEYWLLDDTGKRIAKWGGFYVPSEFLCHGGQGYGDYIIFKIGPDGFIEKWHTPTVEMACSCADGDDEQSAWVALTQPA